MLVHCSMPIKITKKNKNSLPLSYMWHCYNFMQLKYKSLLNLPKNLGRRMQRNKNTYNWLFLLIWSNLPCQFWFWKNSKGIMYASIKQTLDFYEIQYDLYLNLPKMLRKLIAMVNNAYNLPFLILFEHTFIPIKTTILTKNNWAHNYIWHLYHFMQL